MKWTISSVIIPILIVIEIIASIIYSAVFWNTDGIFYGIIITAAGFLIWSFILRKSVDEGIKRNFEAFRKIIEEPHSYRRVDYKDYPEAAVTYYDSAQEELEKIGFYYEADICYHTIDQNYIFFGNSFIRLMHNSNYQIWAAIFKINPPWYTKLFMTMIKCGNFFDGFISLNAVFSDGYTIEYTNSNFNLLTRAIPGIEKQNIRGCSPYDLLSSLGEACKDYSLSVETDDKPAIIPLKNLDEVFEKMCEQEVKEAINNMKVAPKTETLIKEGYSRDTVEKFIKRFNELKDTPDLDDKLD